MFTQFTQFTLALVPVLALLPSVAAHGFVTKVVIDGKTYTGNVPNAKPTDSIIRQISDIGPVKGASNPDTNCGLSAQRATLVASANPGSNLQFFWGNPGQENWPHNTGPSLTYMASCGDTTCDQFDSTTAKWFKIDQIGRKPDGDWFQQDVMNGQPITLALPTQIAAGGYLIRHEIIALHNAVSRGGAEFYPSCTQVLVGGSQSGTPNQTVSFPGAYSDDDPGIFVPDVYNTASTYDFPGPPVSNLASPSDSSNPGDGDQSSSASPSATTTTRRPTGTSTSSGSDAEPTESSSNTMCRLARRDASLARRSSMVQHKRRTSFMRTLRDAVRHS